MYCINKRYGDQDQAQQAGAEREEGDGQKRAIELDDDNNGVAVMFEDDKNGDQSDEDDFEIRDNSDIVRCRSSGPLGLRADQASLSAGHTAGINRSNTAARAVLEQPCSTGGRTDTVRPKREPTGRTDLSDRSRLVLCDRSQELIGQACPTRRQVLRSDRHCPTTSRTRLFEHRSNCRVRPVNAGSAKIQPAQNG
ncbi:hypothetical protein PCASD_21748 [Puccinia coronata f. sp. avenae]|uniref:Uncharacterized protein n=1 Tax=Puccinia coronata f. sp. avenae TaxID=200324 RepID=A0A2N5T6L0_9BASI|nr:hypothetical protein PCASD_21748 [Puccinia coronata f. sp. avenae]